MKTIYWKALGFGIVTLALTACGDDEKKPAAPPDDQTPPQCYVTPATHEQIINGCTDAEKIAKNPVLPLLNSDGSLPPLP